MDFIYFDDQNQCLKNPWLLSLSIKFHDYSRPGKQNHFPCCRNPVWDLAPKLIWIPKWQNFDFEGGGIPFSDFSWSLQIFTIKMQSIPNHKNDIVINSRNSKWFFKISMLRNWKSVKIGGYWAWSWCFTYFCCCEKCKIKGIWTAWSRWKGGLEGGTYWDHPTIIVSQPHYHNLGPLRLGASPRSSRLSKNTGTSWSKLTNYWLVSFTDTSYSVCLETRSLCLGT